MKGNLSSNLGVATYKNIYLGCGGLLLHPHSSPFLFLIFHTFRIFFIQHLDNLGKVFTFFAFFFFTSPSINFAFFRQSVVLVLHPHSLPFSLSHFPLKNPHFSSFSLIIIFSIFCVQGVVLHFLFHFTFHKIRIICILISSLSSSTFWAMCNLFNFQFGFLSARLLPISNVSQLATVVIYFSWKA